MPPPLVVPRAASWTLASVSILTTLGTLGLLYHPSFNTPTLSKPQKKTHKESTLPSGLLEDLIVVLRRFAPNNKLLCYLRRAETAAAHIHQSEPKPVHLVNLSRNQRLCLHAMQQLETQLARHMETASGQLVDVSEDLEQLKTHLEHLMFNAGQVFELRSRTAHSPLARRHGSRPLPSHRKRDARIHEPARHRTSI